MSADNRTYLPHGEGPKVTSFARHVLGEVSLRPGQTRTARREAFGLWLADLVVGPTGYEQSAVLNALDRARLTTDDLVMHCIPEAARSLGQRWASSELSFTLVSLGSARLFGLCHARALDWVGDLTMDGGVSLLVCTIESEDHLIGAAVVTYRLRRLGHSVRCVTRVNAENLVEMLDVGDFDGVFLSCSSLCNLENVAHAVKHVENRACVQVPIILGGPLLHEYDGIKERTGVTLATNDINAALNLIGHGADMSLPKVAE